MKTKALLALIVLCACSAQAQYSTEWAEFDAGTSSHQATGITHAGTFSGWLRRPMQSANYENQQGQPSLPLPVPTPGQPTLTITQAGNNVRLAWPASASNYTLQSADSLDPGTLWTDIPGPYALDGDESFTLIPATNAAAFYRLAAP